MIKSSPFWISVGVHGLVGAACLSFALVTFVDYEQPVGNAVAFDVHPPEPKETPPEVPSREICLEPLDHPEPVVPEERVFRVLEVNEPGLPEAAKIQPRRETDPIKKFNSELKIAADSEPSVSHNPKPAYPILARRKGWEGRVVVRVEVSADGKPVQAHVLVSSGRDVLDEAALEAVRQWTFEPAQRAGRPRAGSIDVTFEFRLDR